MMTDPDRSDCEVHALVKCLLQEHDDASAVAEVLAQFARTCEQIGLLRSAARFRAGVTQLQPPAGQLALQGI